MLPTIHWKLVHTNQKYVPVSQKHWRGKVHEIMQVHFRVIFQTNNYSGVLFKWEIFIQMRMAYFAPNLPLLHLYFGGRKEASRKLSFEWKILIWIGHYSTVLFGSRRE